VAATAGRQPVEHKGKRLGFIIHAHCWVLVSQAMKIPPTEIKLEKFIKACRSHWRKSRLETLVDYNLRWSVTTPVTRPNQAIPELDFECDIYQNPVIIPALQKVIIHAIKRPFTTTSWVYYNRLPTEITLLISEWVCPTDYTSDDVRNMRNILLAFRWDLPDWFWLRRLPEDFFFELDTLRKSSSPPPPRMNLQILRLDVMRLTFRKRNPHCGLANRQRIHKNIVAIKRVLGIA
jgi:hypothetical protein